MQGYVFVAQGDLTHLTADALVYTTDIWGNPGVLQEAFSKAFPQFEALHRSGFEAARNGRAFLDVGDCYWLALSETRKPYGIVVVAVRGRDIDSPDEQQRARRAASIAVSEAVRNLRGLRPKQRLLIALPTLLMGTGGDRQRAVASASEQISAVSQTLRETEQAGVDVVFMTYTQAMYHAYLEARRQVLVRQDDDYKEPDELRALAEHVRRRECVLFVGAGLSIPAGLPGWPELITELESHLGIPSEMRPRSMDADYFLDLAELYQLRHEAEELAQIIRKRYGGLDSTARPTLAHYLLLSLPVRYIITTNYDSLIEQTLSALRRHPISVVKQADVARTGNADGVYVVKFHGDAEHIDSEGIVLSRRDYDAFFQQRPVMSALLEGLLLNQTFLFVGYSLRDPNFRQIHSHIALMLKEAKRPAYAITLDHRAAYLTKESFKNKQLHLLEIPGTGEDQAAQLVRFLDRLAEKVTGDPRLFLAPELPAFLANSAAELIPFRAQLIALGNQFQQVDFNKLSAAEARELAHLLRYLTAQGWRPHGSWNSQPDSPRSLSALWESLAACLGDTYIEEQRRALIAALEHAESDSRVASIRRKLNS